MSATIARMAGHQVAASLRRIHPANAEQLVARDLERAGTAVANVTVRRWLSGEPPGTKHLLALFAVYGPAFAGRVLDVCGQWAMALQTQAELNEIEQQAEAILAACRDRRALDRGKGPEGHHDRGAP
ncbi:MAG TPA: hypothetical protein VNT30_09270 [Stellaceae bacterium]|nr:hypothetical protein [Stellaceae bacterium]